MKPSNPSEPSGVSALSVHETGPVDGSGETRDTIQQLLSAETEKGPRQIEWVDQYPGNKESFLLLICPDGTIYPFQKKDIPGVADIIDFTSEGVFPALKYKIKLAPGIRQLAFPIGEKNSFLNGLQVATKQRFRDWPSFAKTLGISVPAAYAFLTSFRPKAVAGLGPLPDEFKQSVVSVPEVSPIKPVEKRTPITSVYLEPGSTYTKKRGGQELETIEITDNRHVHMNSYWNGANIRVFGGAIVKKWDTNDRIGRRNPPQNNIIVMLPPGAVAIMPAKNPRFNECAVGLEDRVELAALKDLSDEALRVLIGVQTGFGLQFYVHRKLSGIPNTKETAESQITSLLTDCKEATEKVMKAIEEGRPVVLPEVFGGVISMPKPLEYLRLTGDDHDQKRRQEEAWDEMSKVQLSEEEAKEIDTRQKAAFDEGRKYNRLDDAYYIPRPEEVWPKAQALHQLYVIFKQLETNISEGINLRNEAEDSVYGYSSPKARELHEEIDAFMEKIRRFVLEAAFGAYGETHGISGVVIYELNKRLGAIENSYERPYKGDY